MFRTFLAASIAVLTAAGASMCAAKPMPFAWGVNGHPFVQEGYRDIPIAVQLDLVKELGVGWYRSDWSETAVRADPAKFEGLVSEAARRGIRVLPVVFPEIRATSDATPEEIRAAGYRFGYWIGKRFRGKVSHWELDNELDLFAMIRKGETDRKGAVWQWGDASGDMPEHFEEARYAKVRAEMLGLHAGIKAADPKARTIVDSGGYLHYGFFDRLVREDKVPFDILGWHWYSEMGDMTKVNGTIDVWKKIRGYGKPIWVTEINRRGGSLGGAEQEQMEYVAGVARQVRGLPGAAGFFVYELLDEPYFGADNPESHFGLVRVAKGDDGKWRVGTRKEAFAGYTSALKK